MMDHKPRPTEQAAAIPADSRTYLAWPLWKIALLVVPLVGLVVGAGWLAFGRRGEDSLRATSASSTTTTAVPASAPTAPPATSDTTEPPLVDVAPETRPLPPPTPAPTTLTTAAPSAPTWEQIKGASIPGLCGHPPAKLVEGRDVTLSETDGMFELTPILDGGAGIVTGLPSQDGPLTAVVARCNAGGVGWPNSIVLFAPGGTYWGSNDLYDGIDWASGGMEAPGRDGVSTITLNEGRLGVFTTALMDGDAECCPSMDAYLEFVPVNHSLAATRVSMDVGD